MVLRSQFFECSREKLYKNAFEHLEAARSEKIRHFFSSYGKRLTIFYLFEVLSGHIFGASASPRSLPKTLAVSPSSTVHDGQHDTKYVAFELLLHAAFVADEFWGFMLEPARIGRGKERDPAVSLSLWLCPRDPLLRSTTAPIPNLTISNCKGEDSPLKHFRRIIERQPAEEASNDNPLSI